LSLVGEADCGVTKKQRNTIIIIQLEECKSKHTSVNYRSLTLMNTKVNEREIKEEKKVSNSKSYAQ